MSKEQPDRAVKLTDDEFNNMRDCCGTTYLLINGLLYERDCSDEFVLTTFATTKEKDE